MKQSRKVFLIFIAIFAFLASAVTIFSLALEIFEMLEVYGTDFKAAGIELLLNYVVEIVFAFVEISFGVNLIKEVKKNNYFECYKQTSGLLGAIALPLFINIIIEVIFAFINKTPLAGIDVTLLILFFITMTLTSFIRPLILATYTLSISLLGCIKIFANSPSLVNKIKPVVS